MVLTLAAAIFVFGVLVLVHEAGHFVTAKMTGMRVDEFAIGFGPRLFSIQRGETVYSIRCVPLGGFNHIAGMAPGDTEAGPRSYAAKPILSRMLVILAGSAMNLVLPIFLFFAIFVTVGATQVNPEPVFGTVAASSPAAEAGFQSGDRVLRVDGKEITSWVQFTEAVKLSDGVPLTIEAQRGGEAFAATVTPAYNEKEKRALIGVTSETVTTHPDALEAAVLAVKQTGAIISMMLEALVGIFRNLSGAQLAGPVGVAQMAGQVAETGFVPLVRFMAFLSLNLGIVNLLPIPALDGGHFLTLCAEAVRGKPLGEKAFEYLQYAGVAILVLLMLLATKNDIERVFFGG